MTKAFITSVLLLVAAVSATAGELDIDLSPLPIVAKQVFRDVKWTGWTSGEEQGTVTPLRPILVTHAGDGSGRIFVATQRGVIHIISPKGAGDTHVMLDIQERVAYDDKTNEEGLLGMAFHPRFRENGQLFIYYTNHHKPHQNVVSRFRIDAGDPNSASADSEEQLLVLDKPFWNHDGGTICFGPDGKLFIAIGDGGLGKDPYGNGQNLETFQGSILRIDVDADDGDAKYTIPVDNPFVGRSDVRGEIWAHGLRNVWRMAFDRPTGTLWAADVGQDLWEEINLITRGGNYGWNLREGQHPFGEKGSEPRPNLIDPIWEYSHEVGKSITGGLVYRGKALPELDGAYLYADYVTMKVWALWYDAKAKRVTANRELHSPGEPIISFGEDETGEVYLSTVTPTRGSIYRLSRDDR